MSATETPTPEQRRELLELAEKATPLPWPSRSAVIVAVFSRLIGYAKSDLPDKHVPVAIADMAYIVAAANLAPGLVREVERLREGIQSAPHAPNCTYRPFETCMVCGYGEANHPRGECANAPEYKWTPQPPKPCKCWKAALAAGKETE